MVSRAIESVLEQSYTNLELIVIDDGSSDGTRERIQKYSDDERFHYYSQENKGQSAARNFGISKSQGEYIALLDSDNYWLRDKLEKQIEFLRNKEDCDVLFSEVFLVNEHGNVLTKMYSQRFSGYILGRLLQANFVTNNTVLVKKRCFEEMGGFDEDLRYAEDYDLWLRFATRYRFVYHPYEVTYYCCEGERLSFNEEKVLEANHRILTRFFQMFPQSVTTREKNHAWSRFYKWQIESKLNSGKKPSVNDLVKVVSLNPSNIQNWRLLAKSILR
jgi:glycosyltransferase involved in cell wall biosynthesis